MRTDFASRPGAHAHERVSSAFTLIEMLVVISIIAVLMGLILPAVQAAREAARRAQCSNNLKQIALALHGYHDAMGSFPTSFWRGSLDPRTGKAVGINRHSWLAMILPYVEQAPVHNSINFSVGISGGPQNIYGIMNSTALMTPIEVFACPSDPSPVFSAIRRNDSGVGVLNNGGSGPKLSYQGNLGDNYLLNPRYWPFETAPASRPERFGEKGTHTGIMSRTGGTTAMAGITDGTSNTFAVGESLFESCNWFTWPNPNGTISSIEVPINLKITFRASGTVTNASHADSRNWGACMGFRSQHPGVVQFMFCDGRVAAINDTVHRNVYRALSTRNLGETPDSGAY